MSSAAGGPGGVLADVLADLANSSLDLDPASRARLAALEGRRLQIATVVRPFGEQEFTLCVLGGRLRFLPGAEQPPHVIVRGEPSALLAWLLGGEPSGRLAIDGDTAVLTELTAVLRDFQPDLGAPLERLFGAELTRSALGAAELALAGLRSALQGAEQTVRDGAARSFVDRTALEQLLEQLDDLRLRVDRLGARIAAQEQRRTSS